MHAFHPQTTLFFEQFKELISHAINEQQVSIERYVIETHSNNYVNYKFNSQYEFNDDHNYYFDKEWQKNKPLVRYHVRVYQEREQTDISQIIIDDLIQAFIEPNFHFQWVIQYNARLKLIWTEAFFALDIPIDDRQKLFNILGPSTRVHELIKEQFDKPYFFKMMMDTYEKYGGDIAELFYDNVLDDILNNGYAAPEIENELLEVAKKYIQLYMGTFGNDKSEQKKIFDVLRKFLPKEQLIFFKDIFTDITFVDTKTIKKNILDEIPVNVKKLGVDIDAISAHFPEYILENDIISVVYWFTLSIEKEEKQVLGINNIDFRDQYLYIEAEDTIDIEKITYCLYSLLYAASKLSLEAIQKDLIEHRKNNKGFTTLKPYIMKAVLDYELPVTNNKSSFKKI